jgi:mRNA-degrading endonuclease RelE of RelBE toxin-antitoxin system
MLIKIDLQFAPESLKPIIAESINRGQANPYPLRQTTARQDNQKDDLANFDNDPNIITVDDNGLEKTMRLIKDILIKMRISDYVVIQHNKERDKIVIIKKEHGERQGIYHCRHCAMEFEDETQLSAHLRMHYLI